MPEKQLTPSERAVLAVLKTCRGLKNIKSLPEVARLAGITVRDVQKTLNPLIVTHKKDVGSISHKNLHGLFMITNKTERRLAQRNLVGRIIHISQRARTLDKLSEVGEALTQLELAFENNCRGGFATRPQKKTEDADEKVAG